MSVIKSSFINWFAWSKVIRVILGASLVFEGIDSSSYFISAVGAVLLLQGLFAKGCESNNCTI